MMKPIPCYIFFISFCLLVTSCRYDEKRIVHQPVSPPPELQTTAPQNNSYNEQVYKKDLGTALPSPIYNGSEKVFDREDLLVQQCELPSMEYVNDRIFEYGRKLERWKDLDGKAVVRELDESDSEEMVLCFRELQKVLNGYSRLHEELLQQEFTIDSDSISRKEILYLQQRDVTFLESSCGRLLSPDDDKSAGWVEREEEADLPQLETLIERYSSNGEHENVIQVWQQIPVSQVDRVHLSTRILYGNALMYLHQNKEAALVYQDIVDHMSASNEQATDIMSLRKVLADLYTASRNYEEAHNQYLEISKDYKNLSSTEEWAMLQTSILERSGEGGSELEDYADILRDYLGYDPAKDGEKLIWQADEFLEKYPYSPVASNVDLIKAATVTAADSWFEKFIADVDLLASEKRYQDALVKLETLSPATIGNEKQQFLRAKTEDLTLAEAVHLETVKIEKMQELQRKWNEGLLKVADNLYDEAIEVFTAMLDTEYGVKANDKIAEVSLLAARADRRSAADIFLRFTKTTDLESRKKLLIECRRRLMDILVKYPNVEITDKVLGNIKRVEQEMNTVDPDLIRQSEMVDEADDGAPNASMLDNSLLAPQPQGNSSVLQESAIPIEENILR